MIIKPDTINGNNYNDIINNNIISLNNWKGLQKSKLKSNPENFIEFEKRAKNWLHGRRPSIYSNNFYPYLILYAINVCLN